LTWSTELNGIESIECRLRKSDLPALDLNYWLAPWWAGIVLLWNGTPIVAGPIITRPTETVDFVNVNCGGIRSVLANRVIVNEMADWSKLADSEPITFQGLSLGTIAKRVVQRVQMKPGGALPISFPILDEGIKAIPDNLPSCTIEDGSSGPNPCYWDGSVQGNGTGRSYAIIGSEVIYASGADHERTFQPFDLQNLTCDDVLTKLSNVLDGPDIMFKPRLLRDNQLTFDMWHGTHTQPRIAQEYTQVWDTTPNTGQVSDISVITTGTYQAHRVYTTGAGQDKGLLIKVATNDALLGKQFPLLEKVVNTGNSEDPNIVQGYADSNLKANLDPLKEIQLTVRGDGNIPFGKFWPGDLAHVVTKGWLAFPDGITQMRILSLTGDHTNNVKISLQPEAKFV
jgi:hypothetical protein